MSFSEPLLILLLTASPDAGAPPTVKDLLEQYSREMNAQAESDRNDAEKKLDELTKRATTAEKPLMERMSKLVHARPPLEKQVPELAAITLELLKLSKGDFDSERAALGSYLSMGRLAESAKLDPAPYRAEGLKQAQALVKEWPDKSRSHSLLATALMDCKAAPEEVMRELKRCSVLEPESWCSTSLKGMVIDYERPYCAAKNLVAPLTLTGAKARSEGAETFYDEEPRPALTGNEIASVMVDGDGVLSLQTTDDGTRHLREVTARLLQGFDGAMVIKLGDKPLVSARVSGEITNGSLSARAGKKLTLDELCKHVEHPKVPAELRP
jgi:hypothetical protein